ncbi:MAG: ribosome biogenesis GTPase YlqF [Lachnospiraceae bacterium]|nr:ribosome biogenesis GTPase YlqF [Lachnospiraceae bacterium]
MDYQWYPGHMTKARRMMEEDIRLVDLVIELTDARVPAAGRNPDIDSMAGGKARLILLNKSDLADPAANEAWLAYFSGKGIRSALIDARGRGFVRTVEAEIREACREKIERDLRRGIRNRPVRAMVAGIPNVGKSTFINSFAGRGAAKTGNKPGVTKGKQWIRLNKNVELLDTPGILWPKFDDPLVGKKLAAIGSIRDEILDMGELAVSLISYLIKEYPGRLEERYSCEMPQEHREGMPGGEALACLETVAAARNCLKKGGEPDLEKAAKLLMDDFRSGRLGRISLEKYPPES